VTASAPPAAPWTIKGCSTHWPFWGVPLEHTGETTSLTHNNHKHSVHKRLPDQEEWQRPGPAIRAIMQLDLHLLVCSGLPYAVRAFIPLAL
jgi:hypothetical protein